MTEGTKTMRVWEKPVMTRMLADQAEAAPVALLDAAITDS